MSNTIRAFIAVELSDGSKEELAGIIAKLKESGSLVKWVDPRSIHLTIKFLGDIPENMIDPISGRLEDLSSEVTPFEFSLSDIGVFPNWDKCKVVWVGVSDVSNKITDLAGRVGSSMASFGFEEESRRFSPHLTLGRLKASKNKEKLKKLAASIKVEPIITQVGSIVLFKSELTQTGAIHTPLFVHKFTKSC